VVPEVGIGGSCMWLLVRPNQTLPRVACLPAYRVGIKENVTRRIGAAGFISLFHAHSRLQSSAILWPLAAFH